MTIRSALRAIAPYFMLPDTLARYTRAQQRLVPNAHADLLERLDALHVWPQSIAAHYADVLSPRQISELYKIGSVATEAASAIRALLQDQADI